MSRYVFLYYDNCQNKAKNYFSIAFLSKIMYNAESAILQIKCYLTF